MKFFAGVVALSLMTIPMLARAMPPEMVHEEVLTGQELVGVQPLLSVGLARRLLVGGGARLVLRVADEVLSRGGAPLVVADWLRIKAEALFILEQFDTAQTFLSTLSEEARAAYPDLILLLANIERERGGCAVARPLYSDFLIANPIHAKRFQAQLGVALCALESNTLEEAQLQLSLYEQEADRPKQDPLFVLGMAQLAHRKGLVPEENQWMTQLVEMAAPTDPLLRRARLMAVANWEARQHHWNSAIAWVESGLRQEGPLPRLLQLHSHLLNQWLAGKESGAVGEGQHALSEVARQATERRMTGLRVLLQSGGEKPDSPQRLASLETLLQQELEEGLGLVEEGGILQPELLWPGGIPEIYRVAYADHAQRRGEMEQAWLWLEGLTSGESEGQRLLLLLSCDETEEAVVVALLERLAKVGSWSAALKSRGVRALFLLTAQGKTALMIRLRDLLTAALPQTWDVQRALAFHQSSLWAMEPDLDPAVGNRALVGFLSLAYTPNLKPEENRYLPEDPRLAAARLLERLGWPETASALRRQ